MRSSAARRRAANASRRADGRVEPLGVIDRDEERLIPRKHLERGSEARGDRVLIDSPTGRACTTRCDPKSARLWLRELGRNVIE